MSVNSSTTIAPVASLTIHGLLLSLLLLLGAHRPLPHPGSIDREPLFVPIDVLRPPPVLMTQRRPVEGGGSGSRSLLPDAQGQLAPVSRRPFVQPLQERNNDHPILEVPPALNVSEQDLHRLKFSQWGNPLAQAGPPSNGRGRRGGIGDGDGTGIGDGRGDSFGPNDGLRGGAHPIGGGVTAPQLIYKIEPDYSDEARKAKYQGAVSLSIIVDEQGVVRHIEVTRALGLGLDEKAVEAVRKWRFRPGRRDGKPVAVWAGVEVYFRLL